jgi:hypothetical protein
MIKKQQKWIALAVTVAFMWLLQVSAMPLPATETAVAAADQGTDHYEAVGQKAAPAKKKSILPFILIGAGALTVTALVLVLFVLKGYDITGTWQSDWHYNELDYDYDIALIFTGKKKSGTMTETHWGGPGTYAVDGKNVSFTITWANGNTGHFTGTFTDKDTMSGTFYETLWPNTGSWTARRGAAAAVKPERRAPLGNCGAGK